MGSKHTLAMFVRPLDRGVFVLVLLHHRHLGCHCSIFIVLLGSLKTRSLYQQHNET